MQVTDTVCIASGQPLFVRGYSGHILKREGNIGQPHYY